MPQQDYRARLQPKNVATNRQGTSPTILGPNDPSNILYPLYRTGGVLFPYTPSITTGAVADYDPSSFIHSNYGYNAYIRSYPRAISIAAEFTAQTNDEALYLLAVIHFFRSVTKSYFGVNPYNLAGTPPPTLLFNYLGEYQFNNVPVIVKYFDYTYDAKVDYVPISTSTLGTQLVENKRVARSVDSSGGYTYVPTHMAVNLELDTQYVPIDIRNNFNLDEFRRGSLVGKGYL